MKTNESVFFLQKTLKVHTDALLASTCQNKYTFSFMKVTIFMAFGIPFYGIHVFFPSAHAKQTM